MCVFGEILALVRMDITWTVIIHIRHSIRFYQEVDFLHPTLSAFVISC